MRRARPEQTIQAALCEHLRRRAVPKCFWFHTPNGGARTAVEGAIFKSLGLRPGVPDIVLVRDGRTYGLELKAPGGRSSEAQIRAHEELRAAGAEVAVCVGLDAAIKQLGDWQLLRGQAAIAR
jgi:hypothetical protein